MNLDKAEFQYSEKRGIGKKIWNFLKADTWQSTVVVLVLLVILVKYIIFPSLSLITNSALPLVVVESCSMYHDSNLDSWWERNSPWYLSRNITKSDFESFPMKNGFNKGDIIFVWNRAEPEIGDILIFRTDPKFNLPHPVIHRIVTLNPISTKGDNGRTNRNQADFEKEISENQIIGMASLKIPALGWVKLIFFEFQKPADQRGLCR